LTYQAAILWPGGTAIWNIGPGSNSNTQTFNVGGVEGLPAWSADGTQIAFNEHVGDDLGSYYGEVAVYDVSSGAQNALVVATDPSWSPIAGTESFVADLHPAGTSASEAIELFAADGGVLRSVTATSQPTSPQFNPDGTSVAYLQGGQIVVDAALAGGVGSLTITATGVQVFTFVSPGDGTSAITYLGSEFGMCGLSQAVLPAPPFIPNADGGGPYTSESGLIGSVGCTTIVAQNPVTLDLAVADGSDIYVFNPTTTTLPTTESAIGVYVAAPTAVSQVAFTTDGAYLVYATLTPNSSFPDQGQINLTFAPFLSGAPYSATGERTLTTVGTSFALAP
jgi:hypothetical protein